MKTVIYYLLFIFTSCYTSKDLNIIQKNSFNKIISTESISFFGGVHFFAQDDAKKYSLFYHSDTLKFFSINKKNKNLLFDVNFLSDSLIMLTKKNKGKYFYVDTFLFYKNKCKWKSVTYNSEYKEKNDLLLILKTHYSTYFYDEKFKKIVYENFYSKNIDGFNMNESIFTYSLLTDKVPGKLSYKSLDSTITIYNSKEQQKYNFFMGF